MVSPIIRPHISIAFLCVCVKHRHRDNNLQHQYYPFRSLIDIRLYSFIQKKTVKRNSIVQRHTRPTGLQEAIFKRLEETCPLVGYL